MRHRILGNGIQVMLASKRQSAIRCINSAFVRSLLGRALPGYHYQIGHRPRIAAVDPRGELVTARTTRTRLNRDHAQGDRLLAGANALQA